MSAITDISNPAGPALARMLLSLAGAARQVFKQLVRAYRNRSDAAILAALDERMLADMGLTRSDVRDAFAEPLWHDPTSLLRARALERRLSRHSVSLGLKYPRVRPSGAADNAAPRPRTDRPARFTV